MNALSLEWRIAPSLHWLEAWSTWLRLDHTKKGGGVLAEKSMASYLISARHFCRAGTGDLAELLTEQHVTTYFAEQLRSKVPPKSYNHRLTTVRKIVAWALQDGLINVDPTRRIERARQMRLPRRARDDGELAALETAAIVGSHLRRHTQAWSFLGERDYIIWMLFKHTGMRIDMVRRLDLDDLMLTDTPILRVLGKGGLQGEIPVNDELRVALDHWLTVRGDRGTALVCDWERARLSTSQIRRRLQAIGASAGVRIKPHDMRHTRAQNLMDFQIKNGTPVAAAIDITRTLLLHQSISTTLGYLRASQTDLVRVNNLGH